MPRGVYSRKTREKKHPCPACGKLFANEKSAASCVKRCRKVSTATKVEDLGTNMMQALNTLLTKISNIEVMVTNKFAEYDLRFKRQDERFKKLEQNFERGPYNKSRGRPKIHLNELSEYSFMRALPEAIQMHEENGLPPLGSLSAVDIIAAVLFVINGRTKLVNVPADYPRDEKGIPTHVDINYRNRVRKMQTWDHARTLLLTNKFLPDKETMEEVFEHKMKISQNWTYYYTFLCHKSRDGAQTIDCRNTVLQRLANYYFEKPTKQTKSKLQESIEREGDLWWEAVDAEDLYMFVRANKLLDDPEFAPILEKHLGEHPDRLAAYNEEIEYAKQSS